MQRGNLFTQLPDASQEEQFEVLSTFNGGRVRVERIVSEGQGSPDGFWYDQAWDEWVVVLAGEAEVVFAKPDGVEYLAAGDWLLIPAGCRHRVGRTAQGTLWLAVHADTVEGE